MLLSLPAITILGLALGPPEDRPQPASPRLGTPIRLTHDGLEKQRPHWSPDGKRLLYARYEADGGQIWLYTQAIGGTSSPPRRLTSRKSPEYNGAFSHDGSRVLFASITLSGTQGNLDIERVDSDGSGLKKLSDDGGKLVHQDWPAWSPDGKRFAFSSNHEGNQEIYTAAADGSDVSRITQSPGIDAHPCWSPDGGRLVFTTDRWKGLEIASVKVDGTDLVRLTRSPGLDDYPSCAPDGARIAFVSNRDNQFEIYVCNADGGDPVNVSRHPSRESFPTWTPDGLGVTFVSDRDGACDIYTQVLAP